MIAIGGGGRKGGGSLDALNEQVCIAGAIGSVAMQQYPADRLECVVVEVVLELARRWESSPPPTPRLSLVREPQRGVGPAKNRGAAAAGGEVLVFLDADSTLGPTVARDVAAAWAGGARGGSIAVLADSDDFWERGFFHALEFGKRTFGIHGQMFYLDRRLFQPRRGPGPDAPGGRVPADGRQPVAQDPSLQRRPEAGFFRLGATPELAAGAGADVHAGPAGPLPPLGASARR